MTDLCFYLGMDYNEKMHPQGFAKAFYEVNK